MIRRPFQRCFVEPIWAGDKIHTIRPTPKRMPEIDADFVGYYWTGKPYRSPQCTFFSSVVERVEEFSIDRARWFWRNGARIVEVDEMHRLAEHDGFESAKEMLAWFVANHGLPFTGILIEWQQPISIPRALAPLRETLRQAQGDKAQ